VVLKNIYNSHFYQLGSEALKKKKKAELRNKLTPLN